MYQRSFYTLMDAQDATGDSAKAPGVSGHRHLILSVTGATSTVATLKIKGAIGDSIDFGSAASASNPWDYIQIKNLNTGTTVNGDTGATVNAGTTLYEINTNSLDFVGAELSVISAGAVTVTLSSIQNA